MNNKVKLVKMLTELAISTDPKEQASFYDFFETAEEDLEFYATHLDIPLTDVRDIWYNGVEMFTGGE